MACSGSAAVKDAPLNWVDSHCHLDDARMDIVRDEVLQASVAQGVSRFIVAGRSKKYWPIQQQIQQQHSGIFNAFGIHPWYCQQHAPEDINTLIHLLPQAVAIGECGLDFSPRFENRQRQRFWFHTQLDLAIQTQKPVIVHAVKAVDEVIHTLKIYPPLRGVVHGFSGSLQQAKALNQLGFSIGLGSRLWQQNSRLFAGLATGLPLEFLLLESDAPDGLHDAHNTPGHLLTLAETVAQTRKQTRNEILNACTINAEELFHL